MAVLRGAALGESHSLQTRYTVFDAVLVLVDVILQHFLEQASPLRSSSSRGGGGFVGCAHNDMIMFQDGISDGSLSI